MVVGGGEVLEGWEWVSVCAQWERVTQKESQFEYHYKNWGAGGGGGGAIMIMITLM